MATATKNGSTESKIPKKIFKTKQKLGFSLAFRKFSKLFIILLNLILFSGMKEKVIVPKRLNFLLDDG